MVVENRTSIQSVDGEARMMIMMMASEISLKECE